MPKVSIIMPVYNVEAYLRQCLDSVVNQTLRDIEIICVDDGSTDGSAAILREYADKDSRVKVLFHEHTNAGAARNAGMAVATGEYLGFVDSDDWCDSTLFEKAYAKAKVDDADVVSWRFHQYDMRTRKMGAPRVFPASVAKAETPFSPEVLGDGVFAPIAYAPWGRMVRRVFAMQERLSFQEIVRTNDVYFCCLVRALAPRQTIVDEVLYTYRVGTGANLQANNAASSESVVQAWERVARELERRGAFEEFRRRLVSASANSFFYTLNSMPDTPAYVAFFERLRRVYEENHLFLSTQVEDIASCQTAAYFSLFMEKKSPLDFLVGQENYYRERLAIEYWTKLAAQKSLAAETITSQKALQEVKAARVAAEEAQRQSARLAEQLSMLKAEVSERQHALTELKDSLSSLTKENERLLFEKNALAARAETAEKESEARRRSIECLQVEMTILSAEKDKLERSTSFRLGRALTWLPRKAMGRWHLTGGKRKT